MSMFKDIPVEVGLIYEGERIRRKDMQVELGGPSLKEKFELAKVKSLSEVEDGKIAIIGPDIKDMNEGQAYPLGLLVEAQPLIRTASKKTPKKISKIGFLCIFEPPILLLRIR